MTLCWRASWLAVPVRDDFAPEFPVHIRTIYPDQLTDKSYKIDYLALSADGRQPVFVELKTESLSRRVEQDDYLLAAQRVGLACLVDGLLEIFRATTAKRKYFCLLLQLEKMGIVEVPETLHGIMEGTNWRGATAASHAVRNLAEGMATPRILYLQPRGEADDVISFAEFAAVVASHDDGIGPRFAQSLHEWAAVAAGDWASEQRQRRSD